MLSVVLWNFGAADTDLLTAAMVRVLLSSVVFIGVPTLIVWIVSRSQKAGNLTCAGTAGFMILVLFTGVLYPSNPPAAQQPGQPGSQQQAELSTLPTEEQKKEQLAVKALQGVIAEVNPIIKKWEAAGDRYVNAGADNPRTFNQRYTVESRIQMLRNLASLTSQVRAAYAQQEQAFSDAMDPLDLSAEDKAKFLAIWRDIASPEQFDQVRAKELELFQRQYEVLGALADNPDWSVTPHNLIIFMNKPELTDQVKALRAHVRTDLNEAILLHNELRETSQLAQRKHMGQPLLSEGMALDADFSLGESAGTPSAGPTTTITGKTPEPVAVDTSLKHRARRTVAGKAAEDLARSVFTRVTSDANVVLEKQQGSSREYIAAGGADAKSLESTQAIKERYAMLESLMEETLDLMRHFQVIEAKVRNGLLESNLDRNDYNRLMSEWRRTSTFHLAVDVRSKEHIVYQAHRDMLNFLLIEFGNWRTASDGSVEFEDIHKQRRYDGNVRHIERNALALLDANHALKNAKPASVEAAGTPPPLGDHAVTTTTEKPRPLVPNFAQLHRLVLAGGKIPEAAKPTLKAHVDELVSLTQAYKAAIDTYNDYGALLPETLASSQIYTHRSELVSNLGSKTYPLVALHQNELNILARALRKAGVDDKTARATANVWTKATKPELFHSLRKHEKALFEAHQKAYRVIAGSTRQWQIRPSDGVIVFDNAQTAEEYKQALANVAKLSMLVEQAKTEVKKYYKVQE